MHTRLIDFAKYSSLRVGVPLEVQVIESTHECQSLPPNTHIIGKANNLLISPSASHLYMLDKSFAFIEIQPHCVHIGGAMSSGQICSFFKKHDLGGMEFLQGLPGSLGGIIKMNAGLKDRRGGMHEIGDRLLEVNINGTWVRSENLGFGYRTSAIDGVICSAKIHKIAGFAHELTQDFLSLRAHHPKAPSCGSCFKNPKNDYAGRLLESVGLKGFRIGGMGFAQEHANFLVNLGGGRFEEAIELITLAKKRVFESSGIALECEVQIVE